MMNIKPGIGIGPIKFGITEKVLIAQLGSPTSIKEQEYIEGTGNWCRELDYANRHLSFTFDKEDNYRLSCINVEGPNILLFDKKLIGQPKADVIAFIESVCHGVVSTEDYTWEEDSTLKCADYESLGIIFWFQSGYLTNMQCSYLFESDDETIIWPK